MVQDAGRQVHEGVALVGQTGSVLGVITDSVTAAAERVAVIARSSSEQAKSLTEIAAAIADLDTVTQQNANMFQETTAACQSLETATGSMIDMVGRFVTTGQETAPEGQPARRVA